jgi:hypothetical protein
MFFKLLNNLCWTLLFLFSLLITIYKLWPAKWRVYGSVTAPLRNKESVPCYNPPAPFMCMITYYCIYPRALLLIANVQCGWLWSRFLLIPNKGGTFSVNKHVYRYFKRMTKTRRPKERYIYIYIYIYIHLQLSLIIEEDEMKRTCSMHSQMRNLYKILVIKREGRPRCRSEDNFHAPGALP